MLNLTKYLDEIEYKDWQTLLSKNISDISDDEFNRFKELTLVMLDNFRKNNKDE